jgi:hypothetical protein
VGLVDVQARVVSNGPPRVSSKDIIITTLLAPFSGSFALQASESRHAV